MPRLTLQALFCHLALFCILTLAQLTSNCPNQLAVYNPNIRSSCINNTFFIVPIDKTAAANAVKPYKLLDPTVDKSLFPKGFPAGKHPVLVYSGLQSDIRMSALQLQDPLLGGAVSVTSVDRLGDGKTPFQYPVKQYVGGFNGKDISALVPSLVASLGGTTVFVAQFTPNNAAYQAITARPEFISQVKQVIVPNPISGPGVIPEAIDLDFFPSTPTASPYTEHTFHALISQPLILTNLMCQRNPIYFNFTFSEPRFRKGKVTLYSPGAVFPGVYDNQAGYSASGNMLGYTNPETCAQAAARNDPKALA